MKQYIHPLTPAEQEVIERKGTEHPFTGEYWNHFDTGLYLCRKCGTPLYRSERKFSSHCGWPGFDDGISGSVTETLDADGLRTEITCSACGGHLGHIFRGEGFTPKDTRHCVNSLSLHFVPTRSAVFASGCFWGTQYHFDRAEGVLLTTAGFTGGTTENPSYRQVCTGLTGHVEAVEVLYDPEKTSFEQLAKLYFETHDPEQQDGQGPDIGSQYRSVLYYTNEHERACAETLLNELKERGLDPATKLHPTEIFSPAEACHQHYYDEKGGKGKVPYCHIYTKRF